MEKARRYFLNDLKSLVNKLEELEQYYLDWVNLDEYLLIKKTKKGNNQYEEKYLVLKCSKRGNDIYNYRVNKKFELVFEGLKNYENELDCYVLKSNLLFITLTYAERNIYNFQKVGEDLNRFMSNLRKIFKNSKIVIRTFEAQKSGVVHIHLIVYIGNFIDIIKHNDTFRIRNYELLTKIKNCWKYGFSDIQAFIRLEDGLRYILKYVKKNIDTQVSLLTLSLNWLFRKRSFSINYRILRFLFNLRLDLLKHNSNSKIYQNGCYSITYFLVGIFTKEELGIRSQKWFYELNKIPKNVKKLIKIYK